MLVVDILQLCLLQCVKYVYVIMYMLNGKDKKESIFLTILQKFFSIFQVNEYLAQV